MSTRNIGRLATLGVLSGALVAATGCAYCTKRLQDLSDTVELGVTESEEAQFGLYVGLTHLVMVGQTDLRCKLHGLANSQWGTHELVDDSWGWGFLGEDIHAVASGGATLPDSVDLPKYDTGILGLTYGKGAGLKRGLNSPFIYHFGPVGFMLNIKGAEVADFLLGFLGIDLMHDDVGQRPIPPKEEEY